MNPSKTLVLNDQQIVIDRSGRITIAGSGRPATAVRAIEGTFRALLIEGAFDVSVAPGESAEAVIQGDENLLQLVVLRIEDGVLTVGLAQNVAYSSANLLQLRLRVPEMASVRLAGRGSVTLMDVLQDGVAIEISGSGSVTAAGHVRAALLRLTGAGSIDTSALKAEYVAVVVNGEGQVEAFSSERAAVHVIGAGRVRLLGQPAHRDVHCGPAGTVTLVER
ncbi:GIN domain-containing protein [Ralstonia pseudosolanacearum]